ncbi:hypothetical protein [Schlesneria paludicola]|uniref:hypothetical protein n=1 Tax=Schlesneria paludicola TaxID=360056 RepID=UPI00029A4DA7|nr:hypothetical protein [Schlesneria paludicola]
MPDDEPDYRLPASFPSAVYRIFDAARTALSPGSILVAWMVVLGLDLTGQLVDEILPSEGVRTRPLLTTWLSRFGPGQNLLIADLEIGDILLSPWRSVINPAMVALQTGSSTLARFNGLLLFVVALAAWSLVGVVLCRRAAMLLNQHDQSTFISAIRYAIRRWMRVLRAPLIPLGAALVIGCLIAVLGMPGRLPAMGAVWLQVTAPIVTALGFGIAVLVLATAIGWPLMVAAISTDDCDSFGGLSRAYSGLTGRPWHAAVYVILGGIAGCGVMLLVAAIARTTIWCCLSATSFGSGSATAFSGLKPVLTRLVEDLVRGVGASCFWSIATVISLLLRREIDGVPIDRVALDDDQRPERVPLPVVGIPATDAAVKPAD